MRLFPRVVVYALAAFAAGYGITWISSSSANSAKGVKAAIRSARIIASAATSEGGATERLIALCERPNSLSRDQEIFETLQRMDAADFFKAVADFPPLVARFDKLPYGLRTAIAEAAIERWLEVDPEGLKLWLTGAQTLMKNLPGRGEVELDPGVLQAISPDLARNDPDWCLTRIADMKDKSKAEALSCLLRETAKADPGKARKMRESLRGEKEKAAALQGLIAGLAESDPQAALDLVRDVSDPNNQRNARLAVIWAAGPGGATAQRDLISQIDDPKIRPLLLYYAAQAIAEQSTSDPFAFVEEQLSLRTEDERPTLLSGGVIGTLVDTDPNRAAEFVDRLEGKTRASGIESLLQMWPDRDSAATVAWLTTLPPETLPVSSSNWDRTLTKLADRAPAEFQKWVDSLPPGQLQDNSRALLASRQAEQGNLETAIQLFNQSAASGMPESTATAFGRTIAGRDPAKAAECVAHLPPGATQANAALGVASIWSQRNPQAAANWIATLPQGSARDSATNALASTIVYADPAASIEWINQIRDPVIRSKAAENVFGVWTWENPAGARAWLNSLDYLDADRKEVILRMQR